MYGNTNFPFMKMQRQIALPSCTSSSLTDQQFISVFIRLRPLLQVESRICDVPTVNVDGANSIIANASRSDSSRVFSYDRVLPEYTSQWDVFQAVAPSVIESVLDGINSTVFAYGATSAGKTYTMLGTELEPGLMILVLRELFAKIGDFSNTNIRCSFVEIYNEVVHDLLSHYSELTYSPSLEIREDPVSGHTYIQGVTEIDGISEVNEIVTLLHSGNSRRATEPTAANQTSSRSHAILQVTVEQTKSTGERLTSKLSLIDLAGSERAKETRNAGKRFIEGGRINKSLLALGNCVQALSAGRTNFIPYRDSKLTRLLKDSMGGNCRTVMIANVSPFLDHYRDSMNTLLFALRARNVKVQPKKNSIYNPYEEEIRRYKQRIDQLQSNVASLEQQLEHARAESCMYSARTHREGSFDVVEDRRDMHAAPNAQEWDLKKQLMETITEQLQLKGRLAAVETLLDATPCHSGLLQQRQQLVESIHYTENKASELQVLLDRMGLVPAAAQSSNIAKSIETCNEIASRIVESRSTRSLTRQRSLIRNKSMMSLGGIASVEDKLDSLRDTLMALEKESGTATRPRDGEDRTAALSSHPMALGNSNRNQAFGKLQKKPSQSDALQPTPPTAPETRNNCLITFN